MSELLTYGPGIPRYLALWLPLAPLLIAGLVAAGVHRRVIAVVLASTLPTFALHQPPPSVPSGVLVAGVAAVLCAVGAWLGSRLRASQGATFGARQRASAGAVLALVVLTVALRAPLAWLDPGIGDFGTASELAALQLLAGENPYLQANPYATVGTYQYPAGTILAFVPLATVFPAEFAGESHLGARATLWLIDAAAVALLTLGCARLGVARVGLVAAFAYAVHPTLVRESGIVLANDVLLGIAAAAAALALASRRPLLAAAAIGAAVSVKPSALVLVPLLLAARGWRPAALAVVIPAALQAPFLLLPSPGTHGLAAIAEPVARLEEGLALRLSLWAPLSLVLEPTPDLLRILSVVGVVASAALAWAVGRRLRGGRPTLDRAAVAAALPLLAVFALATRWPHNFQDWYLVPLVLAAAASGVGARKSGDGDAGPQRDEDHEQVAQAYGGEPRRL